MPEPARPVLQADELTAVEQVLSDAWDQSVTVCSADLVWRRPHVVRVVATNNRTAIVKRPRKPRDAEEDSDNFAADWTALEFLSGAPRALVPHVFGGDWSRRILVLEELPTGRSLAASLLGHDPMQTEADLVAYAQTMAHAHVWSVTHLDHYLDLRKRSLAQTPLCGWARTVDAENLNAFISLVHELGLTTVGLAAA